MTTNEWLKQFMEQVDAEGGPEEIERKRREYHRQLDVDEKPLTHALQQIGFPVNSVWDLVNNRFAYTRELVSLLIEHFQKPYMSRTREGIVRALTDKSARKSEVPEILYRELERMEEISTPTDDSLRFALLNALNHIGTRQILEKIVVLLAKPGFATMSPSLSLIQKTLKTKMANR